MNLATWRIKKRDGKWRIYQPGKRFVASGSFSDYADAVAYLPTAQRWANRGFQ